MSINRVNISGNLTRDPELRSTQSGTQVLTFGVAVNDRRRNAQTGDWEDVPNFVDCVVFGARAEALSRFLSKGSKVAIEGKLRYSSWERDGQRRSKLEVVVDDLEFMSPRGQSQGAVQRQQPAQQNSYAAPAPSPSYSTPSYNAPSYNAPSTPAYSTPQQSPQQAPQSQPQSQVSQRPPVTTPPSAEVYDEDIPF